MSSFRLSPPVLLTGEHVLDGFECGEPSLDDWLKRRAIKNQASDASRCFVICEDRAVIGYYCLSAGGIGRIAAPEALQRNMPEQLPVLLLGRLAVDRRYHNRGLGSALLRDAMLRAVHIADDTGVFALMVHSLNADFRGPKCDDISHSQVYTNWSRLFPSQGIGAH